MSIRQTDIAKALGISEATVSLALNNKGGVNAETQRKVLEVARRMGYTPNAMARNLVCQRSNVIGIVVTDIANAYFGQFVANCINRILEAGYQPLIASTQDRYSIEEQVIDQFIAQRVAGLIIIPSTKDSSQAQYLSRLDSYGIRYVYATAHHPSADAPYVMVDLQKGAWLAIRYLLDMGHRRILFLGTNPQLIPTMTRLEGYRQAFLERNLVPDDHMIIRCEDADFQSSYLETKRLLQAQKAFDAIVTINDVMALGCLRALLEQGIRVPEDISLIGYDDIVFSEVATIPLTTVHQDVETLARHAVNMLVGMIRDGVQGNEKILIEPHLVVRQSTGLCR